ncbi:MAG TPA: hypothetical protein VJ792_05220 [Candidatus Nitrosotalea sp.]|nr:hypothetical protein [Candidatus Nitrosotalea sp.]
MDHKIEIGSLLVNRLKNKHDDFVKYDIDVSLDEVENDDSGIKLKYRMVLLSNPTNTKLTAEGLVLLHGSENEVAKQLEPDQRNIPLIVNVIYQDVFPLIYIICKSMQIPVPAYKLAQIASTAQTSPPQVQAQQNPIEDGQTGQIVEEIGQVQESENQPEMPTEQADAPVIQ